MSSKTPLRQARSRWAGSSRFYPSFIRLFIYVIAAMALLTTGSAFAFYAPTPKAGVQFNKTSDAITIVQELANSSTLAAGSQQQPTVEAFDLAVLFPAPVGGFLVGPAYDREALALVGGGVATVESFGLDFQDAIGSFGVFGCSFAREIVHSAGATGGGTKGSVSLGTSMPSAKRVVVSVVYTVHYFDNGSTLTAFAISLNLVSLESAPGGAK